MTLECLCDLSFSIKDESKISSTRFSPVLQFGRISGLMPLDVSPDPYGIQTDIIGTGGSSGSPIVDKLDGKVIGIAQRVLPSNTITIIDQKEIYGTAKIGLVYGITNHVIYDLPKKTKDFFEKGIKIDINFASTGFDLQFSGFGKI
jgi:hypothetical protein